VERIARTAGATDRLVAVAESLTSGALASRLGAGSDAQSWYAGGIVAYQLRVKQRVLGVDPGIDPCSAECATQMAAGVRALLGADVSVATTGVGGPGPDNGHEPGTVYIAVSTTAGTHAWLHRFAGEPEQVIDRAVDAALRALDDALKP
jgi:nicotinamide-nucleotide amidase